MDNRKGELSSLATDASENTRRRRIKESVVRKSLEKQTLEEQVKPEQDIARQKEGLEEVNYVVSIEVVYLMKRIFKV